MRYLKYIIILLLLYCSSVTHKPVEVAQLDEVIQRVEADEAIPKEKKVYYEDKFKQARSTIQNQSEYIKQLETDLAKEKRERSEDTKSCSNEVAGLNKKIQDLSITAGRAKQNDYIFWGAIAFSILGLLFAILYLVNKFGTKASPAGIGGSLVTDAIKKSAGLS